MMKLFNIFTTLILITSLSTQAEECSRGSLDKQFCDRDGDMLADTPVDPDKWIDPYELVFSYSPVEDPTIYKKAWSDFVTHLEKETGKKVSFFPFQSNTAEIEAMRIGKLHIAGFNTGSNPKAVNCAGFHPFTMMGKADGSNGYEMEIITYPGSGIEHVADIRGQTIAFTAPTSNSGYKAPTAILQEKFNMKKDLDYHSTFSGKHGNSILGVANKIYKVATIANSVRKRIQKRGIVKKSDIKIIYTSQTFPTTGFGYAHNLKPSLVNSIKRAFKTFAWVKSDGTDSSLKAEFGSSGYDRFVPVDYKKDWDIIRLINSASRANENCK